MVRSCTGAAIPGVAVPAQMFPGVIGVSPSHELMGEMRQREEELRARGGAGRGRSARPRRAGLRERRPPHDSAAGDRR